MVVCKLMNTGGSDGAALRLHTIEQDVRGYERIWLKRWQKYFRGGRDRAWLLQLGEINPAQAPGGAAAAMNENFRTPPPGGEAFVAEMLGGRSCKTGPFQVNSGFGDHSAGMSLTFRK